MTPKDLKENDDEIPEVLKQPTKDLKNFAIGQQMEKLMN